MVSNTSRSVVQCSLPTTTEGGPGDFTSRKGIHHAYGSPTAVGPLSGNSADWEAFHQQLLSWSQLHGDQRQLHHMNVMAQLVFGMG